jgi:hypothetical protein
VRENGLEPVAAKAVSATVGRPESGVDRVAAAGKEVRESKVG